MADQCQSARLTVHSASLDRVLGWTRKGSEWSEEASLHGKQRSFSSASVPAGAPALTWKCKPNQVFPSLSCF